MTQPSLTDLNAFMAVAAHRSFRKAADALGVSRSTLSHAMRGLERQLSVRLLHRTTRSVSLTHEGERLLARLAPLLRELDLTLGDVGASEGQLGGVLRINGGEAAIRLLLRTVVPAFLDRYPAVQLDLVAEGQLVDIVERGFDAGVRLGDAVPKDMVAVRLDADIRFLAVASPGYLATNPPPLVPDELRRHRCIRQRLPSGKRYRWEFGEHGQEVTIDVPGPLTLDNNQLMVEAAADGLGIAYVPEYYAHSGLADGRLVAVLANWCPTTPGLHLYFPANRHESPALRAFIDLAKASR